MKIAVVGSSGYIAGYLLKRFENVLKIDKSLEADADLDLEEAEKFDYSVLDDLDYVIFTAAVSGPDMCANEFEKCWNINVTGTEYFIKNAISHGCKVLFFSSDAAFGDIPGEIYTELSETDAQTPYGRMKKAVEDSFKGNSNFKAIRLSYVVSKNDRFVSYCLKCLNTGETAEIFHPFYRNCITVSDVVNTVEWLVEHWNSFEPQFLNVAGSELVSRVRIADELNRLYDNKLKYVITSPGKDFYKNRPKITQMKSLYLDKFEILENMTFTEKLKKELEDK